MVYRILAVIKDIMREIKKDNVGAFAAQSTFFLVVSAIPFMILFISLLQHTAFSEEELVRFIELSFPEFVAPFIVSIVREMYTRSVEVLSVAIVGALWSSAKGVQYLSNGLNAIYNIEENRNWLALRIRAIGYTIVFVFSIIFSIVFLMLGKVLRRRLLSAFPIVNHFLRLFMSLRHVVFFLALFVLFLFILRFLPNRRTTFKSQVPASAAAAFCWVIMSFLISVYVNFFDGFSMYGSMTTIMLILMYVYFGMYILLVCAEVDSMYESSVRIYLSERRRKKRLVKRLR